MLSGDVSETDKRCKPGVCSISLTSVSYCFHLVVLGRVFYARESISFEHFTCSHTPESVHKHESARDQLFIF